MKPEPGTAFVAARGEERVERLPLHLRRHSCTVIGKNKLDIVMAARPGRDRDRPGAAVGKSVVSGVEDKVSQDLSIRSRIAVNGEAFGYIEDKVDLCLLEHRP